MTRRSDTFSGSRAEDIGGQMLGWFIELGLDSKESTDATAPEAPTSANAGTASGGLTISMSMGAGGSVDQECKPGRFYVYVHKEENGRVFYVGKGTDSRAWSKDRDAEWHQHVARLGGKYIIELVRDGISEEDAVQIEDAVMAMHGDSIINLQNFHAPYDSTKLLAYSKAMGEYSIALRKATKLADTNKHEATQLRFEAAYAAWVEAMRHYDYRLGAWTTPGRSPPVTLADKYTKYLFKSGKLERLIAFEEQFFRDFPGDETRSVILALRKRADRARQLLAKGQR